MIYLNPFLAAFALFWAVVLIVKSDGELTKLTFSQRGVALLLMLGAAFLIKG